MSPRWCLWLKSSIQWPVLVFPSCLPLIPLASDNEPGSRQPPSIFLLVHFQCTCKTVSEFLIWNPVRNDLPTRLQYVGRLPFVFSLTFSSYLARCFFSPTPFSHLWNLSILLSQSVFHPRISPSPGWLKKNLHTLKFTFCDVKLYGFWQMHKERTYHPSSIQKNLTILKLLCGSPL